MLTFYGLPDQQALSENLEAAVVAQHDGDASAPVRNKAANNVGKEQDAQITLSTEELSERARRQVTTITFQFQTSSNSSSFSSITCC
jgi:hypothetical protein